LAYHFHFSIFVDVNRKIKNAPIVVDPALILGRLRWECRRRVKIHLHALLAVRGRTPNGILAYSAERLISHYFCLHGGSWHGSSHALWLGWNLLLALLALPVAAFLSILATTSSSTAMIELAFLSPLALDDILEESVPQNVFRSGGIPLLDFW
jgi:hypothetical protein